MFVTKLEISITFTVPEDYDGETRQERKLVFVRPEKLSRLTTDMGIIGELLREIQGYSPMETERSEKH